MWRIWCLGIGAVIAVAIGTWFAPPDLLADDDPFGSFDEPAEATAAADNPFGTAPASPQPAPRAEGDLFGDAESNFDAVVQQVTDTQNVPGRGDAVAAAGDPLCKCTDSANSLAIERINEVLRSPLTDAGLDFEGMPLEEVVDFLQAEYKIPIQLDIRALDDVGLSPDEQVSINVRNISLKSALRLVLDRYELTYVIRDEVLMITTPEEAEIQFRVCVYDVSDIFPKQALDRRPRSGADFNPLVDILTYCIAYDTWAENGGAGYVRPLPPGLLVISQTQAVHEEIGALLAAIRRTGQRKPVEQARDRGGRGYDRGGGAERGQDVDPFE